MPSTKPTLPTLPCACRKRRSHGDAFRVLLAALPKNMGTGLLGFLRIVAIAPHIAWCRPSCCIQHRPICRTNSKRAMHLAGSNVDEYMVDSGFLLERGSHDAELSRLSHLALR
jgi:hypothetical protein